MYKIFYFLFSSFFLGFAFIVCAYESNLRSGSLLKSANLTASYLKFDDGYDLSNNVDASRDYLRLERLWLDASAAGSVEASLNLGLLYYKGLGLVQKDFSKAVYFFKVAAVKGDARAQYNLGAMYDYGEYVDQNYAEALHWYQLAAEQNYAPAQNRLGFMYYYGQGLHQNINQAHHLWLLASNNNTQAQFNLCLLYFYRQAPPVGANDVYTFCKTPADQGHEKAQFILGRAYYYGEGVEQDYEQAIKWYKLAAENGYPEAQHDLAVLYDEVKEDSIYDLYIYMWVYLAYMNGFEFAKNSLNILNGSMSSSDIMRSVHMSITCVKNDYKNCESL